MANEKFTEDFEEVFSQPSLLVSLMRKTRRWFRFLWQRLYRGWNDSDTWCLDSTYAKFIHPRLVRFKKLNNGFPNGLTEATWNAAIDDMIYAMEIVKNDIHDADWERVKRGLDLFGKHFRDLWW